VRSFRIVQIFPNVVKVTNRRIVRCVVGPNGAHGEMENAYKMYLKELMHGSDKIEMGLTK
jgi:hypothetical protein